MSGIKPPKGELKDALQPGREVTLVDGHGKCRVFPCGAIHLQKYGNAVGTAVATMVNASVKPSLDYKMQYLAHMVPFVMTNLLGLVLECTKHEDPKKDLSAVPHWVLPDLVKAWLLENFDDEKKWGPWMAVAEQALDAFVGKETKISEIRSKLLSLRDTDSKKSSTADAPDSPIPAGA